MSYIKAYLKALFRLLLIAGAFAVIAWGDNYPDLGVYFVYLAVLGAAAGPIELYISKDYNVK